MSSAYVPRDLRQRVAEQARHRCGYCLSREEIVGAVMEIEHVFPRSKGERGADPLQLGVFGEEILAFEFRQEPADLVDVAFHGGLVFLPAGDDPQSVVA